MSTRDPFRTRYIAFLHQPFFNQPVRMSDEELFPVERAKAVVDPWLGVVGQETLQALGQPGAQVGVLQPAGAAHETQDKAEDGIQALGCKKKVEKKSLNGWYAELQMGKAVSPLELMG